MLISLNKILNKIFHIITVLKDGKEKYFFLSTINDFIDRNFINSETARIIDDFSRLVEWASFFCYTSHA